MKPPGGAAAKPSSKPATAQPRPKPSPPVQLTGVHLAGALLPASDFPAGYSVVPTSAVNSGATVSSQPAKHDIAAMKCADIFPFAFAGGFAPGFGETAFATDSLQKPLAGPVKFFNQAVYQFATPAKAAAFFAQLRSAITPCQTGQPGATPTPDSTPIAGDPAVAITVGLPVAGPGGGINPLTMVSPLFVLHGTDVYAIAPGEMAGSPPTPPDSPTAASLAVRLIAAVTALRQS